MTVTALINHFEPNKTDFLPHRPTQGPTYLQTAEKVARLLYLRAYDLLCPPLLPGQIKDAHGRLIRATATMGTLLSNDNLICYNTWLRSCYPKPEIRFLTDGAKPNIDITGVDPLAVMMTEKSGTVVYPFVYPSTRFFTYPHVVLIIADFPQKALYYYDPQGLTSDDPCRKAIFQDKPYFDMHQNLIQLGKLLFPDDATRLIENVGCHQNDPVNCGVLVCRVLKRLYEGKPVEEALQFNPVVDSPVKFRQEMQSELVQSPARPQPASEQEEEPFVIVQ